MALNCSRLEAGASGTARNDHRLGAGVRQAISRRAAIMGIGGIALSAPFVKRARAATTIRMWSFLDPVKGRSSREVVLIRCGV